MTAPESIPLGSAAFWPCECINWCRACDPRRPQPNHHPKCEHYNASIMDVWRVSIPGEGGGLIVDSEDAAKSAAHDEAGEEPLEITKEQMHREVYEQLPEFTGF